MTQPARDSERIDDVELDSVPFDESESLDTDNLLGLDADSDEIDDSWDAPDRLSAATRFGTTPREQREGPSMDRLLAQEQPEPDPYAEAERLESSAALSRDTDTSWDYDDEFGQRPTPTLVADDEGAHPDHTKELIGHEAVARTVRRAHDSAWPMPSEEDAIHIESGR